MVGWLGWFLVSMVYVVFLFGFVCCLVCYLICLLGVDAGLLIMLLLLRCVWFGLRVGGFGFGW